MFLGHKVKIDAAVSMLTKASTCRNRLVLTLVLHDITRWPRIKCFSASLLIITKGGKYSFQVPTQIKAGRAGSMRFFYQSKLEPNNGSGQRGVPFYHLVIPEGDANPFEKRALSLSPS